MKLFETFCEFRAFVFRYRAANENTELEENKIRVIFDWENLWKGVRISLGIILRLFYQRRKEIAIFRWFCQFPEFRGMDLVESLRFLQHPGSKRPKSKNPESRRPKSKRPKSKCQTLCTRVCVWCAILLWVNDGNSSWRCSNGIFQHKICLNKHMQSWWNYPLAPLCSQSNLAYHLHNVCIFHPSPTTMNDVRINLSESLVNKLSVDIFMNNPFLHCVCFANTCKKGKIRKKGIFFKE